MALASRNYSPQKLVKLFHYSDKSLFTREDLEDAEKKEKIPARLDGRKSWLTEQLPEIGRRFGFMSKPRRPLVSSVFVTKGGVLKSSLTLNLARMAALHNIRTCVVGLDMQGDITSALGFDHGLENDQSLTQALERLNQIQGLADVHFGQVKVEDLLEGTDIPTLSFVPETPELVALEQALTHRNRREFWLSENVIEPLKERYDWILLDCSPNWNQLITNALVASDVLISPLECKINNFRNFKMFETFVAEFKRDMRLNFEQIYVPTRFSPTRKLSQDICHWYQTHLSGCTKTAIRDSVQGEEATALHLSLPEHSVSSPAGQEMNQLIFEIWKVHRHLLGENKKSPARSRMNEVTA